MTLIREEEEVQSVLLGDLVRELRVDGPACSLAKLGPSSRYCIVGGVGEA